MRGTREGQERVMRGTREGYEREVAQLEAMGAYCIDTV